MTDTQDTTKTPAADKNAVAAVHTGQTAVVRQPSPMGAAGDTAYRDRPLYDRSQDPALSKSDRVVNDIRNREMREVDDSQRGAGSGENAVLTRTRQYNETVPGAVPALVSPNPQQTAEIQATQDAEDAEKIVEANKPIPALVPHGSVARPLQAGRRDDQREVEEHRKTEDQKQADERKQAEKQADEKKRQAEQQK
jgi:hypothetical protein